MKPRRTIIVLFLLLAGYLVGYFATWLLAPPLARKACVTHANHLYSRAVAFEENYRSAMKEVGYDPNRLRPIASPGGPSVEIGLAIPICPGVLLLKNSYQIGPLFGKGQTTFFLFYGFGVCRLVEITTWIS